jgi:hypothetical protein
MSRDLVMSCRGDIVTLQGTPVDGLWLVNRKDHARILADMSPCHKLNVWRFDDGTTHVICELPAVDIAVVQNSAPVMEMIRKRPRGELWPIHVVFREYVKPTVVRPPASAAPHNPETCRDPACHCFP